MSDPGEELRREVEEAGGREALRERLDRYSDLPLALASIAIVLLAIIQLTGEVTPEWRSTVAIFTWALWSLFVLEFLAKFALATSKRAYLRRNWLDALIVALPVLRVLRFLRVLRLTRGLPIVQLITFGGRGTSAAMDLLRRRRLGRVALISAIVILIAAAVGFLLEAGAPGSRMTSFGDALWWAASTVTTVSADIHPATNAGRVLAFLLMLYGLGVFTYFTASIASVLIGLDAMRTPGAAPGRAPAEPGQSAGDPGEPGRR